MVNRGKWEGRSRKKGKHTIDKETVERDHRGVQHTGYMLKSEASLTGFAVSPWITRTLQRCENFTCAHVCFQRVFPPTFPRHSVYFFSPLRPRTNSAFNCARRANGIFLLLLYPRSYRMFRFNETPLAVSRLIVRWSEDSKKLQNRKNSNRMLQNLVSGKI